MGKAGRDAGCQAPLGAGTLMLTTAPAFSLRSLLFSSPRKPSFPFQWAWERLAMDGQVLLRPGYPLVPGHQALPLPPAVPQRKPRRKSNLEAHGFSWKMKVPNPERKQQLRSWGCISIPSGPGLELPSECGLQPPGKRSDSGSESEEAAELEAPSAEEIERGVSPGELPQLPRRGSILEEKLFAEATKEAEEGKPRAPHRSGAGSWRKGRNPSEEAPREGELQCQGGNSSCDNPRGQRRRKARAKELEGPWALERLHRRQLQQDSACGEHGAQRLGSPGGRAVGRQFERQEFRQGWAALQVLGGTAQWAGREASP